MSIDLKFLEEVARDLPIIRPIKEFIHLNLLLPYQHLPFWEALQKVGLTLEALPFLPMESYRELIRSGELPMELIQSRLEKLPGVPNKELVLERIERGQVHLVHHDVRSGPLHDQWNAAIGINVMDLADGTLTKWLGMFLDQGIAHWKMPGSETKSFYQCIRDLLLSSAVTPAPFDRSRIKEVFPETSEEAISEHLNYLCPEVALQEAYCHESLMTLRGWAGLIYGLQQNPELLSFKRRISLVDFLAVKLVLERCWVESELHKGARPKLSLLSQESIHPLSDPITFTAFRVCQEALEESTYIKVLKVLTGRKILEAPRAQYQAVFCMDDRECSLRRHLENLSPSIETFGTAGHFGIDCLYQHAEDPFPKKQCPAPVPAKYLLRESSDVSGGETQGHELGHGHIQPHRNFLLDWVLSHLLALHGVFKLLRNLFFPLAFKDLSNVREVHLRSKLTLYYTGEVVRDLKVGYTRDEMAQVVYHQLLLIGFVHHLAPLVFFIGHGSSSVNNPYFATYGCGACSGRPGAANARALAQMANDPEVRAIIKTKFGFMIPEETYFLAGLHDTCSDVVELYGVEAAPERLHAAIKRFKDYLSVALFKNARERSRTFKLVTYRPVSKEAQKEVLRRSYSLFETRPELGHTNVAFAIVGRRAFTRGVNLVRRSFLQSYDPTTDSDGAFLAQLLGAVIPVCSGINLDYFFSRMDNLRFGAGSKLPQNVVGNIGVSHGTESDLLFGLPFQMIDQHRPLRLLVLVEQAPEVALKAIQGNPLVRQIVYNNWIHYACVDPLSSKVHFFQNGEMI